MEEGDEVWDGVEGWVNVDGWCILVGRGRVETWEISKEGMDGWGGGESEKVVMKTGEMDGSVVVYGRK